MEVFRMYRDPILLIHATAQYLKVAKKKKEKLSLK